MRSILFGLIFISTSSIASAFIDSNYDLLGMPLPGTIYSDRPDRDTAYELLPKNKWACVPPVDRAGIPLFSNLEITAVSLPPGIENFRLKISVCDTSGRCRTMFSSEFGRASIGQKVSTVWAIEYGCEIKGPSKIEGFQIELLENRPWYKRDPSLDVGYVYVNWLNKGPQQLKTNRGAADFKFEFKTGQ